jgi:hypothetical protein
MAAPPTIVVKQEGSNFSITGKDYNVSERINKHSEELKRLGGKWNSRRGCWILPYDSLLEVKDIIDAIIYEIEQSKIKKPGTQRCGICRKTGHNRLTCPDR